MLIDETTYILPDANYVKVETIKKQIVIAHTGSIDMRHIPKWKHRLNGKYNKTAAFSIDVAGNVYRHFDPIYFSKFIGELELDKKSIIILVENEGWLSKNTENGEFIDWIGHIYSKPESVYEKRWRGHEYWAPYGVEQFESTLELVKKLCDEFFIPKTSVPHNTKLDNINNLEGVLYRSNLEKYYTDLSPAWNCEKFKYKLENE